MHAGHLAPATVQASEVLWYQGSGVGWALADEVQASPVPAGLETDIDALVHRIVRTRRPGEHIVLMSNSGFGDLRHKLVQALGTPV